MCSYFSAVSQSCSQRKPKRYVIMVFSKWSFGGCQYGTIMFWKWPTKDPANNRGEKVNIEYNMTERTTLRKQQNRDWVSPKQKIEQGMLLLQAPEIMSDTVWQMSVNTHYVHMLNLPWLCKCKSNNQPDCSSSPLCTTACSVLHEFFDVGWSCSLTWNVSGNWVVTNMPHKLFCCYLIW